MTIRMPPKVIGQLLAVYMAILAAVAVYGFDLRPESWSYSARIAVSVAIVVIIAVVGYQVSKAEKLPQPLNPWPLKDRSPGNDAGRRPRE